MSCTDIFWYCADVSSELKELIKAEVALAVDRINVHVARAGLTEDHIVRLANWSPKKVRRILTGETRLLVEHLVVLAWILRMPIDGLLREPKRRAA